MGSVVSLATLKAYITAKKDFDLLKRKGSWAEAHCSRQIQFSIGIEYMYMGHIPQDRENEQNMSFFSSFFLSVTVTQWFDFILNVLRRFCLLQS